MKRIFKITLFALAGIAAALALFIAAGWIWEYRPPAQEYVRLSTKADVLGSDTIEILTWNTGYAGLGDDMDFFMDGGRRVRTSRARADENLRAIAEYLASSDADFILLQEVDRGSHRSFGVDQFEFYKERLPGYHAFFAFNYRAFFVPVPIWNPIGEVNAGVAIFSKAEPLRVVRYAYPGSFPFPSRLFNLKRCMLSAEYITADGGLIMIDNTHNSAYDRNGRMRSAETAFMSETLTAWHNGGKLSVTAGDWNQTPPGYVPSAAERNNRYFPSIPVDGDLFPRGWKFSYDSLTPSVRYLYERYNSEVTTTSTIDMFLSSPGITPLEVQTTDLGFINSDHNPTRILVIND